MVPNLAKIGRKRPSFQRAALPAKMGGTAALPILQGLRLNFMTSFPSDMDIYYLNIMTSKQSTIEIMVMTLSWPFEMVLKHNIVSF